MDQRFVGNAIRRRMGAPSSHLGMANQKVACPECGENVRSADLQVDEHGVTHPGVIHERPNYLAARGLSDIAGTPEREAAYGALHDLTNPNA